MSGELSASDVMALANNNSEWVNNPFIYLVWMAIMRYWGGGYGDGATVATQGALTRSDLFDGFNSQDVNSQLRGLTSGLCDGFYTTNTNLSNGFGSTNLALSNGFNSVNQSINNSIFQNQQGMCEINRNIDNVKAEAYQNTCRITTAIHDEGEATRALIQANTIQALRDTIEDKDRALLNANFQISQLNQNAAIIGALRPFPQPAYITTSPYSSSTTTCGCGI